MIVRDIAALKKKRRDLVASGGGHSDDPMAQKHLSTKSVMKKLGLLTTWDVGEDELQRTCRRLGSGVKVWDRKFGGGRRADVGGGWGIGPNIGVVLI